MNKPELYLELQGLTNYEIKKALDNKFSQLIKWRSDKKDSWLDIGCGPGTIIPKYLIPLLPSSFTKIVGTDISEKMLEFADKNYKHPKLSFRVMDIEDVNIEKYLQNENERFDHISCLFVLHCITNQAMALKNIYKLLEPNGDCVIIFCSENTVFDAHFEMNNNKKWQKYVSHLENKLGYYRGITNATDEIIKFLNLAGFVDYKIDIQKNQKHNFLDFQEFQNAIMSVDQYYDHLPEDLKDEYLNDMSRLHFPNYDIEKYISYHLRYDLITVYAKK